MRKLIVSLAAPLLLSAVAVAADDAAPPVAAGAIPSGYVWYSGGSVAVGIGYTWGHGTLCCSKECRVPKCILCPRRPSRRYTTRSPRVSLRLQPAAQRRLPPQRRPTIKGWQRD